MAEPQQHQDDELDVEELEAVAGGNDIGNAELDNPVNNTGCPTNVNCPRS
jgi:hypothetical protein